jgi:hypothetical protein
LETRDLNIAMSEDIAFAHMLHLDKGNIHLSKAGLEQACTFDRVLPAAVEQQMADYA